MTSPGLRLIQEGKSEKREITASDGRGKAVGQPQSGVKLI